MIAKETSLPLASTTKLFPYLHDDPATLSSTHDPFTITTATGFLPYRKPLTKLPDVFDPLIKLLDAMPVTRSDRSPGLLATFELGHMIDDIGALPDLTSAVNDLVIYPSSSSMDKKQQQRQWDLETITAVFRDYSFLASAYLLEPCWRYRCRDPSGGLGLGRERLPTCIAGPMVKCADILNIPPFLAYAASYALYNYTIKTDNEEIDGKPPKKTSPASPIPPSYDTLSLIRAFEHGLDPKSSEAGFILTHIDMVSHSSGLINGTVKLLDHLTEVYNRSHSFKSSKEVQEEEEEEEEAKEGEMAGEKFGARKVGKMRPLTSIVSDPVPDPDILISALNEILMAMNKIEASMQRMWTVSRPQDYLNFRTFIFGITSQSMFPNGVVYDIVPDAASPSSAALSSSSSTSSTPTSTCVTATSIPSLTTVTGSPHTADLRGGPIQPKIDWSQAVHFRGESGANDAIIPLLDSLLTIPMPDNPLTETLHEFRAYRPLPHRQFLAHVRERAQFLNVRGTLMMHTPSLELRGLLLKLLDRIRSFRWRHWMFAKEYIVKRTGYGVATGGSYVVRWLPNQLSAVLGLMVEVWEEETSGYHLERTVIRGDDHGHGGSSWRTSELKEIMDVVYEQREKLDREEERWCQGP